MSAHGLSKAELAKRLGGTVSGDNVLAPGPGHSPRDRSLSVKLDPGASDGFVTHSFAGDPFDVCRDHVRKRAGLSEIDARRGGSPLAEYVYRQADGTPYLRVTRWRQRADGSKAFSQSHWTGATWVRGKPRGDPIPYRLPEILAAPDAPVFICEGEKDADALAAAGLVATTNPEGAGKWRPALNSWFKDRSVVVLEDNDDPGRRHAAEVARQLQGVTASVKVIALPRLPDKGDVSDWIAAGGDPRTLPDLCRNLPDARTARTAQPIGGGRSAPRIGSAFELRRRTFAPIRFVVPDYIAEGCTLLAGRPKLGKSWLMLDIGLAVARGGTCLGGIECEQGGVLYLALEDNERRLQNRIDKLIGGFVPWPTAFEYATEWRPANDGGVDAIKDWIKRTPNPRLVIVDVLARFRPARGDKETLYDADYNAIKGLQAIASEHGVAIVVVHHTRKSAAENDPFEKVSGTLALSGAADTTIVLDRTGNGATLYGRGRDVHEIETAVEFDRESCRWRIVGEAADVRRSEGRTAVLKALAEADGPLSPTEILLASGLVSRSALDTLLYRMVKDGEIEKVGRGRYRRPGA